MKSLALPLPVFSSQDDVHSSVWANYLLSLYNLSDPDVWQLVANDSGTIDLNEFNIFYRKLLPEDLPNVKKTPTALGDYFTDLDPHESGQHVVYRYPFKALPGPEAWTKAHDWLAELNLGDKNESATDGVNGITIPDAEDNQWIEVQHGTMDPSGVGYWYYRMKGSGIWYNVGRTIAFYDHFNAAAYFLSESEIEQIKCDGDAGQAAIVRAAHDQGYNSIQYRIRHEKKFKSEIQTIQLVNKTNCPADMSVIRQYSSEPYICECNNSKECLSCYFPKLSRNLPC